MLIFIVSIFGVYIVVRFWILMVYLNTNKRLSFVRCKFGNLDTEHTKPYIEQWNFLYRIDDNIKKIGNLILAVSSLVGILININQLYVSNLLIIGMFPAFTQIFNSLFEWIEIDTPEFHRPIFPERKPLRDLLRKIHTLNYGQMLIG